MRQFLHDDVFFKVERNTFCTAVLRARQADGLLDQCSLHEDVVSYKPEGLDLSTDQLLDVIASHPSGPAQDADLVVAGFPCQVGCGWSDLFIMSIIAMNALLVRVYPPLERKKD